MSAPLRRSLNKVGGLVLLALLARTLAISLLAFDGDVRDERLMTPSGYEIASSVYSPSTRSVETGAVVLCHGISAARGHMDPMARSLAQRGLLVVSFDYGGHGRSQDRPVREDLNVEDVQAAIALARRHGAKRIALVGHSMGVTSAAAASLSDPNVVCLVALGQRPFVTTSQPYALLMADGAMDPFHPYPNLQSVASEAAGQPIHAQQTTVDPTTGAIRRLFLSGTCEHAGEVYDGAILGELTAFIRTSLAPDSVGEGFTPSRTNTPPGDSSPTWRAPTSVSLRFVSNVAALAALLLLGLALSSHHALPPRTLVLAASLPAVLALGLARLLASPAWGELGATLLLGPLVLGALAARRARDQPTPWRPIARVTAVILGGWLGGTALGAAPAFLERPELLTGLPLYLWQGLAFRVEFTVDALAARLAVGNSWPTALGLLALLAVEATWPGRLLTAAAGFLSRLVSALGGDFGRPKPDAPSAAPQATASEGPTRPDSSATLPAVRRNALLIGALVILLGVAGALFAKRAQEGLLAEEGAMGIVLSAGLRMLVLPLVASAATLWAGRLARALWRRARPSPSRTGFIDSSPTPP